LRCVFWSAPPPGRPPFCAGAAGPSSSNVSLSLSQTHTHTHTHNDEKNAHPRSLSSLFPGASPPPQRERGEKHHTRASRRPVSSSPAPLSRARFATIKTTMAAPNNDAGAPRRLYLAVAEGRSAEEVRGLIEACARSSWFRRDRARRSAINRAEPNERNNGRGEAPLQAAHSLQRGDLVGLLLEHGAEAAALSLDRRHDPLALCIAYGQAEGLQQRWSRRGSGRWRRRRGARAGASDGRGECGSRVAQHGLLARTIIEHSTELRKKERRQREQGTQALRPSSRAPPSLPVAPTPPDAVARARGRQSFPPSFRFYTHAPVPAPPAARH